MRGHATGPFDKQSNLRVQHVQILTPGQTKQLYIDASPTDPVLIIIQPNVDVALSGGTNSLKIGTSANAEAFFAAGDSTPGATGLATAKRFVLTAATTLISVLTSAIIAASKALILNSITGANTQTVTIGSVTYTFLTSLVNTANNVLIGADATAMGANLAAAINAGAGAGTTYGTGTVANPSVTATAALGIVTVTAITPGTGGNAIAIGETLTNSAWSGGAVLLSGGSNVSTVGQITVFIDG